MTTITLYELGAYNNSHLIPQTFNLDLIDSQQDWLETVGEWLHALTEQTGQLCEESIVCDYDGIPAGYVGEFDINPEYWVYKQAVEASYLDAEVFEAAAELDIEPDMAEELYQGEHDNDEDFAYQLADDFGLVPESSDWPSSYIDWSAAARDLMMDYGESSGHYFRTSY